MVRVAPDQERTGVDLQLTLTRLARIEGVVTGIPRGNSSMDNIMLVNADDRLGDALENARADAEGRFRFTNVTPGRYRLILGGTADESSTNVRLGATADVVVAGEDVSNVVLDLQRGTTISMERLPWDGATGRSDCDAHGNPDRSGSARPVVPVHGVSMASPTRPADSCCQMSFPTNIGSRRFRSRRDGS